MPHFVELLAALLSMAIVVGVVIRKGGRTPVTVASMLHNKN